MKEQAVESKVVSMFLREKHTQHTHTGGNINRITKQNNQQGKITLVRGSEYRFDYCLTVFY